MLKLWWWWLCGEATQKFETVLGSSSLVCALDSGLGWTETHLDQIFPPAPSLVAVISLGLHSLIRTVFNTMYFYSQADWLTPKNLLPNIDLRCFVAKQFLSRIYALFWRTFYRPKKCGGVPKMTNMRYEGDAIICYFSFLEKAKVWKNGTARFFWEIKVANFPFLYTTEFFLKFN